MQAPDQPTTIEIAFEKGNPVAIDGVPMSPATILTKLNELGGEAVKGVAPYGACSSVVVVRGGLQEAPVATC